MLRRFFDVSSWVLYGFSNLRLQPRHDSERFGFDADRFAFGFDADCFGFDAPAHGNLRLHEYDLGARFTNPERVSG